MLCDGKNVTRHLSPVTFIHFGCGFAALRFIQLQQLNFIGYYRSTYSH